MLGIELTKWNGDWNAAKAKSAGAVFAFIQASHSDIPDPLFSANWSKAKNENLFRGAYHLLDSAAPVQGQVDCFMETLNSDQGELPFAIQIDAKSFEASKENGAEYLQGFLERVEIQGMTPMIATPTRSWVAAECDFMDWSRYPLWIEDFSSEQSPHIPLPWSRWAFWKFTEKGDGETFGSQSYNIHLSTFHGTLVELLHLVQSTTAQKLEERVQNLEHRIHDIDQFVSLLQSPTPDHFAEGTQLESENAPSTSSVCAVCNANSLNVRNGPGLSHQVIGNLVYNQRVRVIDRREDWAYLQEPRGWVSEKYIAFERS